MSSRLRRAGGFAAVATLALAAPALGRAAAAPFAAIAVLAAFVLEEGPLFELFARPGDRRDRRLNGLAGFALAAAALALIATVPRRPMPVGVFVASVFVLAYGNLGEKVVRESTTDDAVAAAGFVTAGLAAGVLGQAAVAVYRAGEFASLVGFDLPTAAFLAGVGATLAALLRTALYERDDPLVMVSVGIVLWALATLSPTTDALLVGVGLAAGAGLAAVSRVLNAATVTGLLAGVVLALVLAVLGGLWWFGALLTFYGLGALSTAYRYEEKADRGVAQDDGGARSGSNVFGNAGVALLAVVGHAAAMQFSVPAEPFAYLFAGSVATATADTLSSEIGGLFDAPRLITSLKRVPPGTDGAVTWQGELAGALGAAAVAGVVAVARPAVGMTGAGAVLVGGLAGMTADSLFGATVEGGRVNNESVNFLATLVGGAVAAALLVA